MDFSLLTSLAFVLFLLLLSGFFSGSETALTTASRIRLHRMAKEGNKRAKTINKLRRDSESLVGAILLGNNLVNILASAFTTSVLLQLFGDAAIVYTTLGMTLLILVFAEVLPKTIALNKADEVALFIAPFINIMVFFFKPATKTVQIIVHGTLKIFGQTLESNIGQSLGDEELRGAIDLHAKDDATMPAESAMLRSILDLDEVTLEDIMIHRRNLVMIDIDLTNDQIVDQVLSAPFTRLPVYQEQPDNIVGLLHAKDLLRKLREVNNNAGHLNIESIVSEPWFVQESTSLLDQLQAFRTRKEHFAHVIDEYGALMGIVTLEDILEEIVGDITDEHDINVAGVKKQTDGSYLINGTVTLRDLNRQLNWALPDENAATLAGLILHESRDIPTPGQIFKFHGFRFKILRRHRNQIVLIRVSPPPLKKAA